MVWNLAHVHELYVINIFWVHALYSLLLLQKAFQWSYVRFGRYDRNVGCGLPSRGRSSHKIDIIDKFETIKICKEKANIFFARLKTYKAARLEQQCEEN